MRILISNDDGILAPGIRALASAMAKIADIEVIAPDRNRSGASNSLTLTKPLQIKQLENGYHAVDGTPTDCVHLALTGYFDDPIDMVIAGINDGSNLGDDILYSGTVAAAMEGRFLGLPAIAISMVGPNVQYYDTAAAIACQLVTRLQHQNLPSQTILNVNVPNLPLNELKGMQITRLGARHRAAPMVKDEDPRGRTIYWVGPVGPEADAGPGTDFHAVQQGYVSITPLHLDMTNYKLFTQIEDWVNQPIRDIKQ